MASLFRNFLLAERIMRAYNCTPVSVPLLPPTHQHHMWAAWDMAAEMCMLQLPELLKPDSTAEFTPSPFFSEQLTAFELWLEHGSKDKKPPEQLPIVLQVGNGVILCGWWRWDDGLGGKCREVAASGACAYLSPSPMCNALIFTYQLRM